MKVPFHLRSRIRAHRLRFSLIALAVLFAAGVLVQYGTRAYADQNLDQLNSQIAQYNSQIAQYKAQASQLAGQVSTLQTAVAGLQNQIDTLQAQINLSQAQYNQLTQKIADTQAQIVQDQKALGDTLADLYINDQTTPIEMLASSKSISDYLDKQTQRDSIKDSLTSTITEITKLKAELSQQQADVKTVLDKQQADQNSLAATRSQQQNLLDETQGQESAYQALVSKAQGQLAAVNAARSSYLASLLRKGGSGVEGSFQFKNYSGNLGKCGGGYPTSLCNAPLDAFTDQWQLYNRECVSYAAWAEEYRFDKQVNPFHGQGNADEWPTSAPEFSGAWRVSDPQLGDVAVLPATSNNFAPIGHVMIVESSPDSDGWVFVSQYNFGSTGEYSTMDIQTSGVVFLRFPSA